ncbi:hypothetical protein F441_09608 [Phytophthora nicotianae CJ01A1]|uniref:Uncharacterized protein n=1 Tax=Phytophthora nicotianae CJ01A1 TaxID=1317063 RepID=W2X1E7_PHYNI|nr:hypothetical protein F441_09608 [Phytophthora nicotianae CJ01A1]
MVFRFTEDHDKELMREAIAQKPFAAKYGEAARAWASVAEHVSSAIKERVLEKQVRDRVRLLKKNWHAGELRSSLGSGIEETLEAVNEQSHYETLAGLVGQYIQLENAAKDDKMDRINKKKADEASATRCASEIVNEALIVELVTLFGLEGIRTRERTAATGAEGLCILLYKLAVPVGWVDLE